MKRQAQCPDNGLFLHSIAFSPCTVQFEIALSGIDNATRTSTIFHTTLIQDFLDSNASIVH